MLSNAVGAGASDAGGEAEGGGVVEGDGKGEESVGYSEVESVGWRRER